MQSFTGSALKDPAVLALSAKTRVKENSHMSAKLPDLRPALVNISMKDGSSFRAEVETNRGDWLDPYDNAQLKNKYMSLATRRWSDQESEEVYKNLMTIDEFPDVIQVFDNY